MEAASEAEVKVEAAHVETVVELVNENRQEERKVEYTQHPQRREGTRSNRGGERRSRTSEQSEAKDVTVKARPQQKPAEAKSEAAAVTKEAPKLESKPAAAQLAKTAPKSAPVKKASGQNTGFFGRM